MSLLVELMHKGGPFMWLLLLVFVAAPTLTLLGAVLLALRRWVPAVLFWLAPLGLVLFGAIGRIQGQVMAGEAVAHASMETKSVMLHAGLGVAAHTELSGWGMAALALLLSAPLVGIGLAVGAGPGARWRPTAAVMAALAGLVGAVVAVAVAFVQPSGGSPGAEITLLPAFLLVGGFALGLSALRDNDDPVHAPRLASGRVAVAAMVLAGLLCLVVAGSLHGFTVLHEAMAHASAESRRTLMFMGIVGSRAWWLPGASGLLMAVVAGAITSVGGIRHCLGTRYLTSGGLVALGVVLTTVAPIYANFQAWQLAAVTIERHLALQLQQVSDLPRAVALGSDEVDDQPLEGFYRSVAWRGSAWRTGTTFDGLDGGWDLPLDSSEGEPLLVVAPADLAVANLTGTAWARGGEGLEPASLLVAVDLSLGEPPLRSPWLTASDTGVLRLRWIPDEAWSRAVRASAGAPDDDQNFGDERVLPFSSALFVEGRADGLAVHGLLRDLEQVDDLSEAITSLRGHTDGEPEDTIVLVPGSGWNLQDLVSHCLTASAALPDARADSWYDPPSRCAFAAAMPSTFQQRRAAEVQARGGGLDSRGGLGDDFAPGVVGPGATGGDPLILGSLDKTVIQRVIQRHLNQIRYCYQRELTKNPDLAGRVVIKFVVAADGTVSSATVKESTMGDSATEACITGRFMRMTFPAPAGGGIVIVSYPFVFQSAD